MPLARKHIVCLDQTPYYHITSRCVRRAFLCGEDRQTGQSYEHRRSWIENRVRVLSSLFSVDICAYAIMSNHYHLVVRLNLEEATKWSDDEVLVRWTAIFRGPLLVQQYRAGKQLPSAELETIRSICAVYRRRLGNLSWFMKCLNEPIARRANAEDGCTGHFWEARFHSQPLKSHRALLTAMAYVDLNPIRAQLARTPEESAYTSLRVRVFGSETRSKLGQSVAATLGGDEVDHFEIPIRPLMPFTDTVPAQCAQSAATLPIREAEYFKLVDATGRVVVRGKHGQIDKGLEPILERIGLSANQWVGASTAFRRHYRHGDLMLAA
jgi:REP element-mobilizing transposase RayT